MGVVTLATHLGMCLAVTGGSCGQGRQEFNVFMEAGALNFCGWGNARFSRGLCSSFGWALPQVMVGEKEPLVSGYLLVQMGS